jgi:hypothetical protein
MQKKKMPIEENVLPEDAVVRQALWMDVAVQGGQIGRIFAPCAIFELTQEGENLVTFTHYCLITLIRSQVH